MRTLTHRQLRIIDNKVFRLHDLLNELDTTADQLHRVKQWPVSPKRQEIKARALKKKIQKALKTLRTVSHEFDVWGKLTL